MRQLSLNGNQYPICLAWAIEAGSQVGVAYIRWRLRCAYLRAARALLASIKGDNLRRMHRTIRRYAAVDIERGTSRMARSGNQSAKSGQHPAFKEMPSGRAYAVKPRLIGAKQ